MWAAVKLGWIQESYTLETSGHKVTGLIRAPVVGGEGPPRVAIPISHFTACCWDFCPLGVHREFTVVPPHLTSFMSHNLPPQLVWICLLAVIIVKDKQTLYDSTKSLCPSVIEHGRTGAGTCCDFALSQLKYKNAWGSTAGAQVQVVLCSILVVSLSTIPEPWHT